MKTLKIILFIGLFFNLSMMNGQIHPVENEAEQAQTDSLSQKIIGTWNPEGASGVDYIFSQDELAIQINGEAYKTYYWNISTHTTPTGYIISYLIIENTQDGSDRKRYEITALNDDIMNLLYNKKPAFSQTVYYRQ